MKQNWSLCLLQAQQLQYKLGLQNTNIYLENTQFTDKRSCFVHIWQNARTYITFPTVYNFVIHVINWVIEDNISWNHRKRRSRSWTTPRHKHCLRILKYHRWVTLTCEQNGYFSFITMYVNTLLLTEPHIHHGKHFASTILWCHFQINTFFLIMWTNCNRASLQHHHNSDTLHSQWRQYRDQSGSLWRSHDHC